MSDKYQARKTESLLADSSVPCLSLGPATNAPIGVALGIDRRGGLEPVPAINGAEGGLIPELYFTDLASLRKPVLAAAPAGRWSWFTQRSELSSASIAQPACFSSDRKFSRP